MRKLWKISLLMLLLAGLTGCGEAAAENDTAEDTTETQEVSFAEDDVDALQDNNSLYDNEDPESVVTMYLTVSQGNEAENTNHTWAEVNGHSVYYYENLGIERYAVNGLLQVGNEEGPTEGSLGYGQVVPNATVTIRGQTSSNYEQKNYKIELKDGKGKWNEQRTINLNKHEQDGLRFRNKMAYDLMEDLPGMFAMRTQFVHLYVRDDTENPDGQFHDYGLYTQVEQPNKTYLKSHGLDKNGQFYKINMFEFYRYKDVIKLKSDATYDQTAFEERIEIKGSDDHSKLIAMLDRLNDISEPIEDIIAENFQEDNLLSWMAFHILTGNVDTQSRNTLIYSPQNSKKWYFISWDNDDNFMRTENSIRQNENTAGWQHGVSNYWGNVLFQRILKSNTLRADLTEKIEEYRAYLSEERLTELVQKYAAVVKPYAFSGVDALYEPITAEQYDQVCAGVPAEVEANYNEYIESLSEPMPFFIGEPEKIENGFQFTWDNSYDFNQEDIFYTFELSNSLDFTDPIAKEENIFTPGYTYEGTLPAGQYFVRVQAFNTSGKEQYAFDYYVSDGSVKNYGVFCFYIMEDGSVEVDTYEEG